MSGSEPDGPDAAGVREVFAHYRTYHPRAIPRATSESKEWRLVRSRMREGYSAADLKRAIDGYHASPFHCGQNDRGEKYLGFEFILRDGSHVAKGLEYADNPPKARAGPARDVRVGRVEVDPSQEYPEGEQAI